MVKHSVGTQLIDFEMFSTLHRSQPVWESVTATQGYINNPVAGTKLGLFICVIVVVTLTLILPNTTTNMVWILTKRKNQLNSEVKWDETNFCFASRIYDPGRK